MTKNKRAFTLTEILIVIAIIVLLVALAVPAFSLITGGKSIEGATNQLSAALGRARAEAIGVQKAGGVLFFIEPRSQRVNAAIVQSVDAPQQIGTIAQIGNPLPEVWLDLTDSDFIPMPKGVSVQTICDSAVTAGVRASDSYVGFNVAAINASNGATNELGTPVGGLILFDASGRMTSARYGFKLANSDGTATRLGGLLKPATIASVVIGNKDNILRSQLGMVLFERDPFASQGANDADVHISGGTYANSEAAEETWLDANSTPILVNRYTGTLVKGE